MKRISVMHLLLWLVSWTFHVFWTNAKAAEIRINLYGPKGEISSPNYPHHYPLNITIVWTIRTDPRNRIIIQFTDFELEKVKRCIYDYVQLREDDRTPWGSKRLRRYCGKTFPPDFITKGPKAQIRFRSDYYNFVAKGFRAFWIVVIGSAIVPTRSVIVTEKPPLCSKETKTVVLVKACTTNSPTSRYNGKRYCPCKNENGKNNNLIQSHLNPMQSSMIAKHSTCNNIPAKHFAKHGEEGNGMSHLLSAFTAMLVLFLLTTIILVFFLWRRRRELRYLRMARCQDPGLYPVLEWNLYKKNRPSSSCRTEKRNSYIIDTTAETNQKLVCNSSQSATNSYSSRHDSGHRIRYYRGTPDSHNERYLTMLSDVTRQPLSSLQHSDSEEEDDQDDHDTSDAYISTEFSSPSNSCESYHHRRQYEV